MPRFIVNRNAQKPPRRDHEIHNVTTGCNHLPDSNNQIDLGTHPSCVEALRAAKRMFPSADGCAYCCKPCNHG